MGISLRIFLVSDDDSIQRLPLVKFERLQKGDPKERLSEYAGKRIRYALVAVEMESRKPGKIIMIQYLYLHLDREGRIDEREREKAMRLGANMMPPIIQEEPSERVIKAEHMFAKKQYDDRFTWKPTQQIEEAIVKAVYGFR